LITALAYLAALTGTLCHLITEYVDAYGRNRTKYARLILLSPLVPFYVFVKGIFILIKDALGIKETPIRPSYDVTGTY